MAERIMVKGNEAMAEAAIRAGCRLYFGYPITPQSEFTEYMARRMPEVDGVFLQSESEVAAVNMVYGAACTGHRVMTSTSSPGFSLMQEGVSYIAGAKLPAVFVNVVRGGPGLGDIQPAQSDYFQSTKGGGHGDYHLIVLAPGSIQEAVDLMETAFRLADNYRVPVMMLADGMLGQMMEPVVFPEFVKLEEINDHSSWALRGADGREPHKVTSFDIDPVKLEEMNTETHKVYEEIRSKEIRFETHDLEDADYILVGYGTMGRILGSVVKTARKQGIKVGLFRPITLWPFPYDELKKAARGKKFCTVVEMSTGQMVEDVRLSVEGSLPVHFYGRTGGMVPTPDEVFRELVRLIG